MFSHTCHITWHIICKDKKYTTGQKSFGKTQENGNIFLSRVTEQSKGQDSYNTVEQEWGAGLVIKKKGQPGACSSRLRRVRGRVRPLRSFCTQPFPAFLQEAGTRT